MVVQNGYLENLLVFTKLTQFRLVPIQIHGQSELDWVSFWKKNACFQGSYFVCVGEGRAVVMVVSVSGSVGVLMRFVWRSLGVGMGVLWWGWVCVGWVWVGGCVIMPILTISMCTKCLLNLAKKWTEWVLEKKPSSNVLLLLSCQKITLNDFVNGLRLMTYDLWPHTLWLALRV